MQRFDCDSTRNCRLLQHFGLHRLERNEARNRRLLMHIDRGQEQLRFFGGAQPVDIEPAEGGDAAGAILSVRVAVLAGQVQWPGAAGKDIGSGGEVHGSGVGRGAWDEWHVR